MKKILLCSIVLVLLFSLTSCFKPAFTVLNLSIDKNSVQSGETFKLDWKLQSSGSHLETGYKIHIDNGTDVEIIETDEITYSGTLTAGSYSIEVEAVVTERVGFQDQISTVESNTIDLWVYEPQINFLNTVDRFNTDSFTIEWEAVDGLEHEYLCSVNGGEVFETTATSTFIEGLSEGENQFVEVKLKESECLPSRFYFEIDQTGPTVVFTSGTDRERPVTQKSGLLPFGRYMTLYWGYTEIPAALRVCFRQNSAEGRPYFIFNDDGSVSLTANRNDAWIYQDPEENFLFFSNEVIMVNDEFYDVFETGEDYVMYIQAVDELGNEGPLNYESFTFNERYDEDHTPIIGTLPYDYNAPTDEASGMLTMTVIAPNVKEYCSDYSHEYFGNDTTYNSDLVYLEIHFADYNEYLKSGELELVDVIFPNFMEGKTDLSSHRVNEDGEIEMYRAFINGPDEGNASFYYAVLQFAVDKSIDGIQLPYYQTFDYYIRDDQNRTIDGIIVDNHIWAANLVESQAPQTPEM